MHSLLHTLTAACTHYRTHSLCIHSLLHTLALPTLALHMLALHTLTAVHTHIAHTHWLTTAHTLTHADTHWCMVASHEATTALSPCTCPWQTTTLRKTEKIQFSAWQHSCSIARQHGTYSHMDYAVWGSYPRSQAVCCSVLLTAYVTFEPPGEAGEGLV